MLLLDKRSLYCIVQYSSIARARYDQVDLRSQSIYGAICLTNPSTFGYNSPRDHHMMHETYRIIREVTMSSSTDSPQEAESVQINFSKIWPSAQNGPRCNEVLSRGAWSHTQRQPAVDRWSLDEFQSVRNKQHPSQENIVSKHLSESRFNSAVPAGP